MLSDPGRVSSVVAITHAYWCLPARRRGRPLLDLCYGAQSLHSRYGLSVALSTLRRGRYLARRKAGFPLAGWALAGREFHPLDECGFVWAHLRLQSQALFDPVAFERDECRGGDASHHRDGVRVVRCKGLAGLVSDDYDHTEQSPLMQQGRREHGLHARFQGWLRSGLIVPVVVH